MEEGETKVYTFPKSTHLPSTHSHHDSKEPKGLQFNNKISKDKQNIVLKTKLKNQQSDYCETPNHFEKFSNSV